MESNTYIETSLRDLFRVIFRHKIVVALFFVLIVPSIYIKQELKTPFYRSKVKMFVKGVKPSEADYYKAASSGPAAFIAATQTSLINTRVIIERVVDSLKLYQRPLDFDEMQIASNLRKYFIKKEIEVVELQLQTMTAAEKQIFLFDRAVGRLSGSIQSYVVPESQMFMITVSDYNPVASKIITNSLSRSFVIFDLEQQIAELKLKYGEKHSSVLQLNSHIEELYKTLDGRELPFIEAIGPASIKIIEQALFSSMEGVVNKNAALILGFLVSLFGGIGAAFVLDYLSQTINSQKDVGQYLNLSFLGSIPKATSNNKKRSGKFNLNNDHIDFYKNITNQLEFLTKNSNFRSTIFTGIDNARDTANVLISIGFCLVRNRLNHKVLIIDADMRNALVSKSLDIENTPGLSNVLDGTSLFEDAVQNLDLSMDILSAGQLETNPVTKIDASAMKDVLDRAGKMYDVLLINSPDLKNYTDAVILSSLVDSLVIVINEGKVKHQIVNMAIAPIKNNNDLVLSVILNDCRMVIPKIIYNRI